MINLLDNAGAAINKKEGRIEITVIMTNNIAKYGVAVADDGPGGARNYKEKCFEPYFLKNHKESGTGLGLAL